jgi:hypothetical protein
MPDRERLRARARRRVAKRKRGGWEKQVRKEVDRAIQVGVDALVDAASRKLSARAHVPSQPKHRVRVEETAPEVLEAEVVEETDRKRLDH